MAFADNLQALPGIEHLAALHLLNAQGERIASIDNKPGKQGSLRVYAALAAKHGSINTAAAQEGLELFAEHTTDARSNPGKHPNIDRLLDVIEQGSTYQVELEKA
ncbi:DUF2322 family protein [Curvibacter sp. CHRR-16]|uniref:DUF2322 family protein n=1 Tax=Curvibacter sp. CHRR-16 TaxID=2835872 RepID=UPI001BD98B19|nr:DUF2322 family protein [Curvibacter sp. CHRR-16]MBT0569232.1 DUF2322 family protein [Curvibacter sp. CHRR-16]